MSNKLLATAFEASLGGMSVTSYPKRRQQGNRDHCVYGWLLSFGMFGKCSGQLYRPGDEPYYPVNDKKNGALYERYKKLALKEERVIFGGRHNE